MNNAICSISRRCLLTSGIFGSPLIHKLSHLGGLVSDKSNDHAVEVKEEHDQVETQLEERFLLVDIELAENLSRIEEVSVVNNLLDVPAK
jgi:hypothetical protein